MLGDDRNHVADSESHIDSFTETAGPLGYTEVTFNDAITTAGTNPKFKAIYVRPLVGPTGQPVDFSKPFTLMTMIEAINHTGDFGDGDKCRMMYGLGMSAHDGVNDAVSHADNRYISLGWDQNNATFPNGMKPGKGRVSNYQVSSASSNADCKLLVTTFSHGPDVGASMAVGSNTMATFSYYEVSGEDYRRDTSASNINFILTDLTADAIKAVTQVQLFAYVGARITIDGSNDPAVAKFRLWYMVTHDPTGWGGSGA